MEEAEPYFALVAGLDRLARLEIFFGGPASRRVDAPSLEQKLAGHADELHGFGVASLSVFGSVARGTAHPDSDVDLLVRFDGPATFDQYMGLRLWLEDLLGVGVDLVTEKGLRPALAGVAREAVRVA